MTAGRIPKPTNIHHLSGNPSKINMTKRESEEPQYAALDDFTPPEWLDDESKGYWVELAKRFSAIRVLTSMDTVALELLIVTYKEWRDCLRYLEANGKSYTTSTTSGDTKYAAYPEVGQMQVARNDVLRMLQQFGWTPASRTKVKVLGGEADPMMDFINQGRGK